jgi:hypothetical protein
MNDPRYIDDTEDFSSYGDEWWTVYYEAPGAAPLQLSVTDWLRSAEENLARTLESIGAKARESGCARCAGAFDTLEPHSRISLVHELRPQGEASRELGRQCRARFCPNCSRRLAPIFSADSEPEPEARRKVESVQLAHDDTDLWLVVDGEQIARRGRKGTPEAGTWVSVVPGWTVAGEGPTGLAGLTLLFNGRRVLM